MTQDTLFQLVKAFEAGHASRLEYTEGDSRLVLEKNTAVPVAPAPAPAAPSPAGSPEAAPEAQMVQSPLVGTFYAAAEPGGAPFVKSGDSVHKGQTVCIVEAMKMINEIPAPCDCVIEECLVKDGALVGFGDGLFRIREL